MDSRGIPIVLPGSKYSSPRRNTKQTNMRNELTSSPFVLPSLKNEPSLLEVYDSFADSCFQSHYSMLNDDARYNVLELYKSEICPSENETPTRTPIENDLATSESKVPELQSSRKSTFKIPSSILSEENGPFDSHCLEYKPMSQQDTSKHILHTNRRQTDQLIGFSDVSSTQGSDIIPTTVSDIVPAQMSDISIIQEFATPPTRDSNMNLTEQSDINMTCDSDINITYESELTCTQESSVTLMQEYNINKAVDFLNPSDSSNKACQLSTYSEDRTNVEISDNNSSIAKHECESTMSQKTPASKRRKTEIESTPVVKRVTRNQKKMADEIFPEVKAAKAPVRRSGRKLEKPPELIAEKTSDKTVARTSRRTADTKVVSEKKMEKVMPGPRRGRNSKKGTTIAQKEEKKEKPVIISSKPAKMFPKTQNSVDVPVAEKDVDTVSEKGVHEIAEKSVNAVTKMDVNKPSENIVNPTIEKNTSEDSLKTYKEQKKERDDKEIDVIMEGFPGLARYYKFIERAGRGTFSKVYKAKDLMAEHYMAVDRCHSLVSEPNDYVAVKLIFDISAPLRVYNEIHFLTLLRSSPCVTPLITAFRHEPYTYVVLPYISFDHFDEFFLDMTMSDVKAYISQLLIGLRSVHANGIIHRDVKPGNFLYSNKTKLGYLADFGLAQKELSFRREGAGLVPSSQYTKEHNEGGHYIYDRRPTFQGARSGTKGFRAPEVMLKYSNQTTAIDIWAVGVLLLTILSGRYPFFNPEDDSDAIIEFAHLFGMKNLRDFIQHYGRTMKTNIPSIPEEEIDIEALCREMNKKNIEKWDNEEFLQAVDLSKHCLELIHTKRYTAEEALNHPFLKQ